MADEPIKITASTQILVEGEDDKIFFEKFKEHALGKEKSANIQIQIYEDKYNLRNFLHLFATSPGAVKIQSVGIVRDADESETGALQSIQSALESLESEDVDWPSPDSVNVCVQGPPSVTALILPGGERRGALETLLCDTLRDELTACIGEYFECAERWTEATDQLTAQRDKGRAKVYLAARKPPDISVSSSVQSEKYWNFEHDAFGIVREFLEVVSGASGFPLARE